jgi:xanthine dehydrogenase YagS FAD-binding subunit
MHHPFSYHQAESASDAMAHLASREAMPLGGGTDLLVLIEESLARPMELVDLRRIPGWRGIEQSSDGGVRIGAATRIHDIARNADVRSRFGALAAACEVVGTPALRRMGTIGGNLCQRPRCWYFRRAIPCLKNGGSACPAVGGENEYLAIVDNGPCHIVHPSDPAVALTALGARIELERAGSSRTVEIEEFYVLPSERLDHETILEPGEVVRSVVIPGTSAGGVQRYHKLMQRETWDFALVSIAAVRRADGDVRIALGGVAPRPWRVSNSVEEDIASCGGGLDDDAIDAITARALYDVTPLSKNGYKVELASTLLRRVAKELTA